MRLSPPRIAARADAPVLLIHGKDDIVVPFEQSPTWPTRCKDAGKPVELVVLRGEDHWLSRAATRCRCSRRRSAFVEKHNPAD